MSDPSLGFVASGDLPPYPSGLDTAELATWFDSVGGLVGAEVDERLEQASEQVPPRVMMVGDSVGWFVGRGLEERADAHGLDAWNTAVFGCGIGRGGEVVQGQGAIPSAPCDPFAERWASQLDDFGPDVVVVHTGLWDLTDRRLPEWDGFHHIGEPIYDRWLGAELDAAVEVLTSRGTSVVWLTSPCHDELDEGVLTAARRSTTLGSSTSTTWSCPRSTVATTRWRSSTSTGWCVPAARSRRRSAASTNSTPRRRALQRRGVEVDRRSAAVVHAVDDPPRALTHGRAPPQLLWRSASTSAVSRSS